jgi:hypothetical protein
MYLYIRFTNMYACAYKYIYIHIYIYMHYRTQKGNRDIAIKKLKVMISEAYIEPKDRIQYEGMYMYIYKYICIYI